MEETRQVRPENAPRAEDDGRGRARTSNATPKRDSGSRQWQASTAHALNRRAVIRIVQTHSEGPGSRCRLTRRKKQRAVSAIDEDTSSVAVESADGRKGSTKPVKIAGTSARKRTTAKKGIFVVVEEPGLPPDDRHSILAKRTTRPTDRRSDVVSRYVSLTPRVARLYRSSPRVVALNNPAAHGPHHRRRISRVVKKRAHFGVPC